MKAKRKPTTKAPREPRLTRAGLEKMVAHLADRIQEQVYVGEAIMKASEPHNETMSCLVPMLTVIHLSLKAHMRETQEIFDLADSVRGHLLP
jgi:hypothetical protein